MECCLNRKIIIAIDGYSGCGKSTFAQAIAARVGYIFIDTGAMYRGVTLFGIRRGVIRAEQLDSEALVALLPQINLSFTFNPARGASDLLLDGENVESLIRSIEVSNAVSQVSQLGEVRKKLVAIQQQMGNRKGVVMDGRDIGTVVFPEAELKIFMTASMEVRIQRRYDELMAKGEQVSREEIQRNLHERDLADKQRTISPLRKAPDALVLDNSDMTLDEQMAWVMGILLQRSQHPLIK